MSNHRAADSAAQPAAQHYSPSFCAQRLKALADPHRFAILTLLLDSPKYVWELNAALDLEQSLLSHHLKVLRQEGLVHSAREGREVRYDLAPGVRMASQQEINLQCCVLSLSAFTLSALSGAAKQASS